MQLSQKTRKSETRWPSGIAVVAIGGLFAVLPSSLLLAGPRWLPLAIVLVLLVPTIISHRIGHHSLNQILGYVVNGVVTTAMISVARFAHQRRD